MTVKIFRLKFLKRISFKETFGKQCLLNIFNYLLRRFWISEALPSWESRNQKRSCHSNVGDWFTLDRKAISLRFRRVVGGPPEKKRSNSQLPKKNWIPSVLFLKSIISNWDSQFELIQQLFSLTPQQLWSLIQNNFWLFTGRFAQNDVALIGSWWYA